MQLTTINDASAQVLVHAGVISLSDLKKMDLAEIARILGIEVSSAQKMIDELNQAVAEERVKEEIDMEEDIVSASAIPGQSVGTIKPTAKQEEDVSNDKFSEAEKRLRDELAAFKLK
jgi:N utilization substance protein A